MRADGDALQALDAHLLVPYGDFQCEIPFFILRRGGWERSVIRERADRQVIAKTRGQRAEHIAHELADGGKGGVIDRLHIGH